VLAGVAGPSPALVLRLAFEEVCLRRDAGEPDAAGQLAGRFPALAGQIRQMAAFHDLVAEPPTHFPVPRESLGEFRLVSELGRGAAGRVYLAAQPALDGRPVVLKVSRQPNAERLALARLQHAHVVPLFGARDFPELGLQSLCMPYLGGLTLAAALSRLSGKPPARRTGSDLLAVVDDARAAAPVPLPARTPVRIFLAGVSYEHAVCWLGACLADALQYAHDRGVLHLDVKPGNILLAADGQPMLLDFHLARGPVAAGGPPPDWFGGTAGYMPPEQEAAIHCVRSATPLEAAVDGRAGVYALGAVLYEALAGHAPGPRPGARQLRRANPSVAVSLADLVTRCLDPAPARR
jgi:serine/threonine protein kinase